MQKDVKRLWWRRPWRRCRRAGGWSRTTLLRVRMQLGERIVEEPVLMRLERWTAQVKPSGLVRILAPHLGLELALGRRVHWRPLAKMPRTADGLRAAVAAWKVVLGDASRVRVLEPLAPGVDGRHDLDACLSRAVVLALVARKGGAAPKNVAPSSIETESSIKP